MTVYGYARVSTGRQATEGDSLAAQQRQIEGYCMQHSFPLHGVVVEEGVSGGMMMAQRPASAGLLEVLQAGDIVVAAKLDRLFRSAIDALQTVEHLKTLGVSVHLLDLGGDVAGNGLSKLFLTIAAAFAEAERDRIRERVQSAKTDQKARGEYMGGTTPFGFSKDRGSEIEENPKRMEALGYMRTRYKAGDSLRLIAENVVKMFDMQISYGTVRRLMFTDVGIDPDANEGTTTRKWKRKRKVKRAA